jgi:hypothetical protein
MSGGIIDCDEELLITRGSFILDSPRGYSGTMPKDASERLSLNLLSNFCCSRILCIYCGPTQNLDIKQT